MFVTLRNITFSNNPDVSILCVFNISFAAIDWQISRWLFVNKANVFTAASFLSNAVRFSNKLGG
ncbi:MAG: hypothetical protein ACRCZA_13295 [Shewanella sp.]|uniref:hypothetical protein n=1 Tax=Shewanella sp. TaxID=50422 RepID=UPI003F2C41C1